MKGKFTDEQIDKVLTRLMAESAVDDAVINEIAESPTGWWAVKRSLVARETVVSPWPPASAWRRILSFGLPMMAAFAVVVGVYVWTTSDRNQPTIADVQRETPFASSEQTTAPTIATNDIPVAISNLATDRDEVLRPAAKSVTKLSRVRLSLPRNLAAKPKPAPETVTTEFIALSHAGGPESGQVVRVRVPSSMMVSLGVVSSVEKPASLVKAEVVIGDDGQTHAIRFIR